MQNQGTTTPTGSATTFSAAPPSGPTFVGPAPRTSSIPLANPPKKTFLKGLLIFLLGLIVGAAIFFLLTILNPCKPQSCPEEPSCPATPAPSISSSDLDLGFLRLEPNGQNLIYSPLSMKYALHLLRDGATGATEAEITSVLGSSSLTAYHDIPEKLSLANAVFIRDTFEPYVLPSYLASVAAYDASILYDPFESAEPINSWVSDKTFNLIKNPLRDEQITPNTRMVLVNALAIDLAWAERFKDTTPSPFTAADDTVSVAMMNLETHSDAIAYYQDDTVTAARMDLEPLDDAQLEMVAILPTSTDLPAYLETLEDADLDHIINNLTPASTPAAGVSLFLPQFKFDYNLNFTPDLNALGITTAFAPLATFTKMTDPDHPLTVDGAVHKATVACSEQGIKAAATTIFTMVDSALPIDDQPQPVVIRFDRPFLFLIRDKSTGEKWFVGTVYQPTAWEDLEIVE